VYRGSPHITSSALFGYHFLVVIARPRPELEACYLICKSKIAWEVGGDATFERMLVTRDADLASVMKRLLDNLLIGQGNIGEGPFMPFPSGMSGSGCTGSQMADSSRLSFHSNPIRGSTMGQRF
jgi:hypothetical protein